MSAGEPLQTVWAALESHGFQPRGREHDFRAKCPHHDGQSRDSLHCYIGADGSAQLYCFAHQCDRLDIATSVGLNLGDLYPAGHQQARRQPAFQAQRKDFEGNASDAADLLYALEKIGDPWRVEITAPCSRCGGPRALYVVSRRYAAFLSCPSGCTAQAAAQALAGRVADLKATA
jgi:hypothetical protein